MKKKIMINLLLLAGLIGWQDIGQAALVNGTDSPLSTIFNYQTGVVSQEGIHKIESTDNLVRLVYQGKDILGDTVYINSSGKVMPYKDVPNGRIEDKEVIKISNMGYIDGEPIKVAIRPLDTKTADFQSKTWYEESNGGIKPKARTIKNRYDEMEIWVEDSKGNIIDNPNNVYLLSMINTHRNTAVYAMKNIYKTASIKQNYIVPSDSQKIQIDQVNNGGKYELRVESAAIPGGTRYYTVGFRQTKNDILIFGRTVNIAGETSTMDGDTLFSPKYKSGLAVSYPKPIIQPTKTKNLKKEDWYKADLFVKQSVSSQAFDVQYANPLIVTIDVGDHINSDLINLDDIKFFSEKNGTEIELIQKELSKTGVGNPKIIVTIPLSTLKEIGDDTIDIKGKLPLKLDYPNLYEDAKDGIITVNDVFAKNNMKDAESNAPLQVQIPAPTGEPVPNIRIVEGTDSNNLIPKDMVRNLESVIDDDVVEVVGFKTPKKFDTIKNDNITVIIKSKKSGLTSEIVVPLIVFSKDLDVLESIKIIPEANKVAANKEEMTYNPIFKQVVKNSPSGITQMNNLTITAKYDKHIDAKETDFEVFADNVKLTNDKYQLKLTKNENKVEVTFNNSVINQLLGKTVEIRQKSIINTSDESILALYDSTTKQFEFPIEASNSFNTIKDATRIEYSVDKKKQIISYTPKIKAEAVPEHIVEVGSTPKAVKEYLKNISQPDFDFDEYVITFKDGQIDFNTTGKKTFNIIVKSKSFGEFIEVPVTVDVQGEVGMTVNFILNNPDGTKGSLVDIENPELKIIGPIKKNVNIQDDFAKILKGYSDENIPGYTFNKLEVIENGAVVNDHTKVPRTDFEVNLYYDGTLMLDSPDAFDFGSHKLSVLGNEQIRPITSNNNDMNLEVINTQGLGKGWKLSAKQSKPLTNKGEEFKGKMYYISKPNAEPIVLESKAKEIEADRTTSKVINQFTLSSKDSKKTGLYLDIYPGNKLGDYTDGEITWNLEDTP